MAPFLPQLNLIDDDYAQGPALHGLFVLVATRITVIVSRWDAAPVMHRVSFDLRRHGVLHRSQDAAPVQSSARLRKRAYTRMLATVKLMYIPRTSQNQSRYDGKAIIPSPRWTRNTLASSKHTDTHSLEREPAWRREERKYHRR